MCFRGTPQPGLRPPRSEVFPSLIGLLQLIGHSLGGRVPGHIFRGLTCLYPEAAMTSVISSLVYIQKCMLSQSGGWKSKIKVLAK